MLGAISLDLFAVLFGGAIALAAPLRPHDPPHRARSGSASCAAPRRSARSLAGLHAHPAAAARGRPGATLLVVVAAFGVGMIVFGLSRSLPLSLAALAVSGFVDMISVNIRSTIAVALATPDALRGRVLAVEIVFISASNELGAFESGAAAALLGAVAAVVAGGAITIALAAGWRWLFPALARIDRTRGARARTGGERPRRRVGFAADGDVRIPPILRPEAGGNRQVEVDGATVREVLENLVATYPALRERIFAGDELPQFLNVFVDGSDVRLLDGLETAVADGATVILLPAVAGG